MGMYDFLNRKNNIILGYHINNNKIIVNVDIGNFRKKKYVIDKTAENEKIVLDEMRKKAKSLDFVKVSEEYVKAQNMALGSASAAILCVFIFALSMQYLFVAISLAIMTFICFGFMALSICKLVREDKKLVNIAYLENEELINKTISKNERILERFPSKVWKIVNRETGVPNFDINLINQLSCEELKSILFQINAHEQINAEIEESTKVLTKKLNK